MNEQRQLKTSFEGCRKKFQEVSSSYLSDSERCDSVELDNEIQILIGKNSALESCKKLESCSCALTAFSKHNTVVSSEQMDSDKEDKKTSDILLEHILAKKIPRDVLEQQIVSLEKQKVELLAVNNQWDQEFRRMKQRYEKKVTDIKQKTEAMQKNIRELEKERHQLQEECQRLKDLTTTNLVDEMRQHKTLKGENKLLREETALANTKKMHYEREISRLNKALQDALKNRSTSSNEPPHLDALDTSCNEEMRLEMEVLRQQVQIYEEDFKKERSDRERLNSEKEALQKINERSQSQLNKLHSQIKDFQEEKRLLQKQVKQQVQELRLLTQKQGFPHHLASNVTCHLCLSYRNCGLLHYYPEPQITLASRGVNRKEQEPPVS
ncbi:TNFAIP3-interacting protein 3 [Anolis carolinensis]|uniref:TNFAIP3-interacting protein 3 n=1 Tax=Anolis carolinensis TaxID=28377 RepID=UPI000462D066|nr:PREDICTED: TNFAIP3-interacting protein 3 [Anolis carolinensis]|eukprot:XP_008110269.1 PREDICTED: TNFAIP3-interacting protein 3 [Anolis carolinensis]